MTDVLSNQSIRNEVFAIVANQANIDVTTIRSESTLKDLGIASLDAIEVLFDIEETFDITFPDQGTNFDTDTVQHLIDAIVEAQSSPTALPGGAA